MDMTPEQAIDAMWRLADKPERLRCFHKILTEIGPPPPTLYWETLWGVWTSSESLFLDQDLFPDLFAFAEGNPHDGLDDDEREALAKLPAVVTVYRGGCDLNRMGWSWTLDKDKAKWFAGRAYNPHDEQRWLVTAKVAKRDVMALLMGRGENEIVADPDNLFGVRYKQVEDCTNNPSLAIFHAIQTGKMKHGDDAVRAIAEMRMSHGDTKGMVEEAKRQRPFCQWAGLERLRDIDAILEVAAEQEKSNAEG